ncbi:Predicted periplasmic lipoprotein [Serratia fonticola]|uniref:Predicted periplasmic lipoprotein n=1 Tax=Serratia fonticola TaxID=47917 RepID=A0A4U9WFJ0_SERFO|nr:Predicted periplasmic lipoprotein [Serratia fonticola]
MKPIKKMIATGCLLLTTNGCSSVASHTGADQGYYSGTRANVDMMKSEDTSWAMMPLLAIDLPPVGGDGHHFAALRLPAFWQRIKRAALTQKPVSSMMKSKTWLPVAIQARAWQLHQHRPGCS